MQGAHAEASDIEAIKHDDPEKVEARRLLNATVASYTLEAGVILHRSPSNPWRMRVRVHARPEAAQQPAHILDALASQSLYLPCARWMCSRRLRFNRFTSFVGKYLQPAAEPEW